MPKDHDIVSWADIADYWDYKQGDTGDLWHRALIDPPVLALVGAVKGLRVLDLACGNGYLTRRLARAGAAAVGVDSSGPIIARAKAREAATPVGVTYHVLDATDLAPLPNAAFDVVVCNMALMDMPDPATALREAGRVLVMGGRIVASIEHPCFQTGSGSAWLTERSPSGGTQIARKVSRYREIFSEDNVAWRVARGVKVFTRSYHRPLSWYARAFNDAGLAITAMDEPSPTPEFLATDDEAPFIQQVPVHLVFAALKVA